MYLTCLSLLHFLPWQELVESICLLETSYKNSSTSYKTPHRAVTAPFLWGVLYETGERNNYFPFLWYSIAVFSYNFVIVSYMKVLHVFSVGYRLRYTVYFCQPIYSFFQNVTVLYDNLPFYVLIVLYEPVGVSFHHFVN